MSIFICSKCGCEENTALCRFWRKGEDRPENPVPLCSACDPKIGKWHGQFPQQKPEPKKPMRQQFVWMEFVEDRAMFGGGKFAPIDWTGPKPDKVWTVLPQAGGMEKNHPPALPFVPVHNQNAFSEDAVHDWSIHQGKFRYYTRVMDRSVWILLEFKS